MKLSYEQLEAIINNIIYDTDLESIDDLLEHLSIFCDKSIEVMDECEDHYINEVMERFKRGEIHVMCYSCGELHRFNSLCEASHVGLFKKYPYKSGFSCEVDSSDYDRPWFISYSKFMEMWTEEELRERERGER